MTSQEKPPVDPDQIARERQQLKRDDRRRWLLRGLVVVVAIAAIAWALYYFMIGRWYESTDDAYVNGNIVQITPQLPGTVVSIGADDNDYVQQGQALVKLDTSTAQVALDAAEANLAATVRKVRGLYSGVGSSRAEVAVREAALAQARADYKRRQGLAKSGAISAEELSHASDALTAAESALPACSSNSTPATRWSRTRRSPPTRT